MSDITEENLQNPLIAEHLRASKRAKCGLILLVLGFDLQIVGTWMT